MNDDNAEEIHGQLKKITNRISSNPSDQLYMPVNTRQSPNGRRDSRQKNVVLQRNADNTMNWL